MRILYVITGLGVGGAERQVVDLAERFAAQGDHVVIAYMAGTAKLIPSNRQIRLIGFHMQKSIGGFFHAYLSLRRLLRVYKPDVVHSHMVHANLLARSVRLTTRMRRLVNTAHSTNEGGRLRMMAYRLTHALSDVCTNVSQEAVDAFEAKGAVPRGTMLSVTNGVDLDRFYFDKSWRETTRSNGALEPTDRLIMAIGRLEIAKDYPNLFYAFSKILYHYKNVYLWIVGDDSLSANLILLAEELNISKNVRFFGMRNDISQLINAADIFVLSSAWEGFGLVVAEAMACEKVVVATDCGGVKEVLGDCGFLVPPRDSDALSLSLIKALSMLPLERKAMGIRARQRVAHKFSIDEAVNKWRDIYAS